MAARSWFLLVAFVILAAGVCFLLLEMLGGEAGGEGDPSADPRPSRSGGAQGGPSAGEPPAPGAASIRTAQFEGDEPPMTAGLFSAELMALARIKFLEGWAEVRQQPPAPAAIAEGMAEFRRQVENLAHALGKRMAEKRNKQDLVDKALESADGVLLVEAAARGDWKATKEALEAGLLAQIFAKGGTGTSVDGASYFKDRKNTLRPGMHITFGPGFHKLDERRLRGNPRTGGFPEDVTIEGAGMDHTLLQVGDISARSEIRRLRVRRLTLDCGDNYLFDLRRGALTIDLERVRIVRFDMGAGGSLAFGVNKGAMIRGQNCEILGGYGRSPGSGNLFRGSALVARFQSCLFSYLDLDLRSWGGNSLVLFEGCRFENMRADPRKPTRSVAVFEDCSVGPILDFRQYHGRKRLPLTNLFPSYDGK